MARSPFPRPFLVIALLSFTLLVIPHDAIGALDEHCCYYVGPLGGPIQGLKCVLTTANCTFDWPATPLCYQDASRSAYKFWDYYPSPPDPVTTENWSVNYWCVEPLWVGTMGAVSGAVTPCNDATDCSYNNACNDTGNVANDVDGNGDTDFCDGGTWKDCNTYNECNTASCYHCDASKNCVLQTESTVAQCTDDSDNDCDGKINEKDPDCCNWCIGMNYAWDLNSPGPICGDSKNITFWEAVPPQEKWCCGDDSAVEKYEGCEVEVGAGISWRTSCDSSTDLACCNSPSCVEPDINPDIPACFDVGKAHDVPSKTGSDSFAQCPPDGKWKDCDTSKYNCSGCAGVPGFPCTVGENCWAKGGESAAFGEYNPGTATECCGDDQDERYRTSAYHSSIEFPPAPTSACCNNLTDCVNGSRCYADGATADVDSNGDSDVCSGGTWKECTLDSHCSGLCCNPGNNKCGSCNKEDDVAGGCTDRLDNDGDDLFDYDDPDCCSWCEDLPNAWFDSNAPGPETPVGCGSSFSMWELGEGFQQQWCCGNNITTEFNKTGYDFRACCNATTDCVDALGTCRIGSEFSPGGCTDQYDHDCDGLNNFNDGNCRATLDGTVTDDKDAPIENATVTAVAVDPITVLTDPPMAHVQYTTVTDINGYYEMNVTKGLDYDIVVKVPGYGTGFEWNISVGEDGRSGFDFKIKKAENCEDDCTSPGENWCRPECWGLGPTNDCQFTDTHAASVCDGAQKDWIIPYDATHEVQCCEGAPAPRKQTQVVGVSGAKSVVRVTRIISYAGQLITLVIDVFK